MRSNLNEQEERFVNELLKWDQKDRSLQWFLCHIFLILGGVVFVAAAIFTARNLNDRTALWVMLPGSLIAIVFFVLYAVIEHRIRERRLVASVFKKLLERLQ